jgi:hypothetical protein
MLAKVAITTVQRTMFVYRKSAQPVGVIRTLIGLTDIFAKHTRRKAKAENDKRNIYKRFLHFPDNLNPQR